MPVTPWNGSAALALDVVVEPGQLLRRAHRDVRRLVLAALVAQAGEEQRDVGARVLRPRPVVEAECLVGREQVVGPAARDQQRGRCLRVIDVVRRVVRRQLVADVGKRRQRIAECVVVRLTRVEYRVPVAQIRVGIGARRRVEECVAACVQRVLPGRLQHARAALVGRVVHVVERAAVRHQRVRQVRPRDLRRRRRDLHRGAVGALPCGQGPVREHLAVLQRGKGHREPAAVGTADRADLRRRGDALVGQLASQLLGVANLVASVHQADVAVVARRAQLRARRGGPARLAEATRRHADRRVALVEERGHVRERKLRARVTVEQHDQRVGTVRPGDGLGREGDPDVDRHAVERRHGAPRGAAGIPGDRVITQPHTAALHGAGNRRGGVGENARDRRARGRGARRAHRRRCRRRPAGRRPSASGGAACSPLPLV